MFEVAELLKSAKGKLVSGRKGLKVRGISIDSRTIKSGECFIAIRGDNFDGHDFIEQAVRKGACCIIKDRRPTNYELRATSLIEVKDTTKALGDIARFRRDQFKIPVIAVTGSNGKTTAKEMIAWALSAKYKVLKNEGTKNNHIGLPMTLVNLDASHNLAVLEIGTNHFGEVDNLSRICRPNVGVITNIGPSHLEYFGSLKGVLREKYTLINNLRAPHICILNADDELLRERISRPKDKAFAVSFALDSRVDFAASDVRRFRNRLQFLVNNKYKFTLPTPGVYNIYNALASIAVARIFGMGYKDIARRLADFKFPRGRLNFITLKEIKFIDDTYNANPLSLEEALDVLADFKVKGRRILVMGDMMELGRNKESFHLQAGRKIAKACDALIAVGELSKLAASEATACGLDSKHTFSCRDSTQARRILFNELSPNAKDIVLVKGSRAMKMEEVLKA